MYLLDTNILSELVKKRSNINLITRLGTKESHALCTSSICIMELRYGSALRKDFNEFWAKIKKEIIDRVKVFPIGDQEALVAGDILASLRKSGQTLGIEDILIASTAIANKGKMVTANTRHYSRIEGLVVENWLEK